MFQTQTRSHARLIEGEIALQHHRTLEPVEPFRNGKKILDSWISRFLLARVYVAAGHYAEALSEFELCRSRSGEAADLFLADMPTLRYFPPLFYWLGRARRAQEGLGPADAARASYQDFVKLRTDADIGAPLVPDARKRIADRQ